MSRIARIIIPHYPHHIIQRGNRSQQVFFSEQDKRTYLYLLEENCKKERIHIIAYCLMDNHVHLVVVPETAEGLSRGIGAVHRRYTGLINQRMRWYGYLWQGRFKSYVMDDAHLIRAVRYIERNPVAVGIVQRAQEYKWSSARAHVCNTGDRILSTQVNYVDFSTWDEYVNTSEDEDQISLFKLHEVSGKPLGRIGDTHACVPCQ